MPVGQLPLETRQLWLLVYTTPHPRTVLLTLFLDDITNHLTDLLTVYQNNLIMGDFNIHIDYQTDSDANIFNDTMTALGLVQHVSIPTHKKGNTLDLIYTVLGTNFSVSNIQSGPMMSDHRLIYTSQYT